MGDVIVQALSDSHQSTARPLVPSSSPNPLGYSKPHFMKSLHESKFIQMVLGTWLRWPPRSIVVNCWIRAKTIEFTMGLWPRRRNFTQVFRLFGLISREAMPSMSINDLKMSLRFPCHGLNTIIDYVFHTPSYLRCFMRRSFFLFAKEKTRQYTYTFKVRIKLMKCYPFSMSVHNSAFLMTVLKLNWI